MAALGRQGTMLILASWLKLFLSLPLILSQVSLLFFSFFLFFFSSFPPSGRVRAPHLEPLDDSPCLLVTTRPGRSGRFLTGKMETLDSRLTAPSASGHCHLGKSRSSVLLWCR
ncbi:hypothetical protein F5X96DRAFT_387784 [Biscogniauxia mediterranea]|nr:hypothetical protein F5X96DRAFT_387784 [Biscogniauxia mediterranea]